MKFNTICMKFDQKIKKT